MTTEPQNAFRWTGAMAAHLDGPQVTLHSDVVIGCYGGNSEAGAVANEDAAWLLHGPDWRFAALIDAHYSTDSDDLILKLLQQQQAAIYSALSDSPGLAFESLRTILLQSMADEEFQAACSNIVGEASCIFAAQKSKFLFWLSIGDCLAFVLHPELARLSQFAVNQRHFFEWVGRSNVFDLAAASHSTGVQELRQGFNTIALVTDGLYEYPLSPYSDPGAIYAALGPERRGGNLSDCVGQALETVHNGRGRDSATVVAWQTNVQERSNRSSRVPK